MKICDKIKASSERTAAFVSFEFFPPATSGGQSNLCVCVCVSLFSVCVCVFVFVCCLCVYKCPVLLLLCVLWCLGNDCVCMHVFAVRPVSVSVCLRVLSL